MIGRHGPSRIFPTGFLRDSAAIIAFLVASSMPSPCSAQAAVAQKADVSATLVLAWAELDSGGSGPEYRDAATLIPRQLMARLSFVHERYPSSEEIAIATRKKSASGVVSARKAVAEARKKRDLEALSIRDPAKRAASSIVNDKALLEAEDALMIAITASKEPLGDASPTDSGSSVAIETWADHKKGLLVPLSGGLAAICEEKKVDLLVHGSIRPKGTYIAVELSLYAAAVGRDIWSATEYAFADGLDDLVAAFERPAAQAVLGRSYARAVFRITPPVADLYLDGKIFAGDDALYFEPGSHEAEARALGYAKTGTVFGVTPGSDAFVDLSLQERDSTGFSLASAPPGAAVHVDGILEGYAPLELPGAAYSRVARISMPGFDDVQIVIRPESSGESRIVALDPADGSTFDERFDDKKGAFYRSLGWFIVSLPVTVISGGLFQTYYQSEQAYAASGGSDDDVIDMLNGKFYTSQAAFWASASVSAGLAAWAIVRLAAYIGAAR
ncbi:MAG: hypothetical protein CVV47_01845 [Spirochaetae bacterium HGW-Spirochaetae-3]|nr:MAG: hypothetical protein CVV47_01845 [Spirochaetae bacterium HGW-Spirochaetae-3]